MGPTAWFDKNNKRHFRGPKQQKPGAFQWRTWPESRGGNRESLIRWQPSAEYKKKKETKQKNGVVAYVLKLNWVGRATRRQSMESDSAKGTTQTVRLAAATWHDLPRWRQNFLILTISQWQLSADVPWMFSVVQSLVSFFFFALGMIYFSPNWWDDRAVAMPSCRCVNFGGLYWSSLPELSMVACPTSVCSLVITVHLKLENSITKLMKNQRFTLLVIYWYSTVYSSYYYYFVLLNHF